MKILLIFPPAAPPISPYLSAPILAGQLINAGYDTEIIDLSVEFFEYILNTNFLMNSYNCIKNELPELCKITGNKKLEDTGFKSYSKKMKTAVAKKQHIQELLKDDENNLEIIKNIDKYINDYKNPEIFYNLSKIEQSAIKINKAFAIAMMPSFPLYCRFSSYKNPLYKSNFQAIKKQILNPENNSVLYDFYKKKINEYNIDKYDMICVSCPNETQILPSLILTKLLKENSSAKIVIGGNIISRISEELKEEPDAFGIFYDYILTGCGENSIIKLADYLNGKNIKLNKIKGLIYKTENKLYFNEPDLKYNINKSAMMSLKGLKLDKYFTPDIIMPIQSSKGCYWGKCIFCGLHYPLMFHSVKRPSKTVDEIEYLNKTYGIKIFEFIDEAIHPRYLSKLADEILKRNLNILWVCCARLENKFYTPELCEKLYRAGLRLIEFGYETASKEIFKELDKGINFDNRLNIVKQIANAGIWTYLYAIAGYPMETKEQAVKTLSVKKDNDEIVDTLFIQYFWLDKKSPAYKKYKSLQIKTVEHNKNFSQRCKFTKLKGMTKEDMEELDILNKKQNPMYNYLYFSSDEYFFLYAIHFGRNKLRSMLKKIDTDN